MEVEGTWAASQAARVEQMEGSVAVGKPEDAAEAAASALGRVGMATGFQEGVGPEVAERAEVVMARGVLAVATVVAGAMEASPAGVKVEEGRAVVGWVVEATGWVVGTESAARVEERVAGATAADEAEAGARGMEETAVVTAVVMVVAEMAVEVRGEEARAVVEMVAEETVVAAREHGWAAREGSRVGVARVVVGGAVVAMAVEEMTAARAVVATGEVAMAACRVGVEVAREAAARVAVGREAVATAVAAEGLVLVDVEERLEEAATEEAAKVEGWAVGLEVAVE